MKSRAGLGFLLGALVAVPTGASEPLRVTDAFVPEPPPLSSVAAAYFTLRNETDRTLRIVDAAGECAPRIELHQTTHHEGRARMQRLPVLTLAPGEAAALEPGGLHVMLHDASLSLGDVCRFALVLDDGRTLPVEAPVRPRMADGHAAPSPEHEGDCH